MKIDIRQIDTGEDEVIVRYREKTYRIQKILDAVEGGDAKLYGKKDGDTVSIDPGDVLYFETVDDKLFAYTAEEIYNVKLRLYQIEEFSNQAGIIRVSKSHLINVNKIMSVRPALNSRLYVRMQNGEDVLVSRKYAHILKEMIA